jgi:shikimate dehydrogenase
MAPHGDHAPLTEAEMSSLSAGTIVYDLIYVPRPTRLLALAQQFGLEAIDGSEMLVQQGAAALKIWTQQPVPVAVMREALWGTENLQNH